MNVRSVQKASILLAAAGLMAIVACLMIGLSAHAAGFNLGMADGANAARGTNQATDLFGQAGTFRTITNVMLYLVGAISVIMLIIGGLRYVVSGGDSSAVQAAKNTILYAIVGIIVCILAYAVVSFIIGSFSSGGGGSAVGGSSLSPTNT